MNCTERSDSCQLKTAVQKYFRGIPQAKPQASPSRLKIARDYATFKQMMRAVAAALILFLLAGAAPAGENKAMLGTDWIGHLFSSGIRCSRWPGDFCADPETKLKRDPYSLYGKVPIA